MELTQDCTVFGKCGGCSLLDIPYDRQLKDKAGQIRSLFQEIAPEEAFMPIKGMDAPAHYRDKVIAPLAPGRKGKNGKRGIVTGMYQKGTHRIIEADSCLLENAIAQKVTRSVIQIMRRHGIEPYDEDSGKGFLRHVVTRVGHESGEVLVTLVTNSDEFPYSKSFCKELVKKVPAVTTVVQNVNKRQTNVILGEKEKVLYGPGFILDTLCGLSFRISSQSFYQVNSAQTEVLYESAIELARLTGKETAIDAYCGTGTIGLVAASQGAARVVGVDEVNSSIKDARQNARHNGIGNAEFVVGDATAFMAALAAEPWEGNGPVVLFMDPPRAGSSPEFINAACQMKPDRIVYISCNPETQLRDVEQFVKRGYEIEAVQPIDMFPHTPHIENIVSMVRS